ncbi:unnamed protein product [Lathyrus sativus]|nr:unnamed protein product [Lathyrus sativus]
MAKPFSIVKDINDGKEFWKMALRIHHKWSLNSKNKEHFEIIVVDKKRSDIHVKVSTMYKQSFDFVLAVNNTYTIANFQVMLNELLFKSSDHNYVLVFIGGTSVCNKNKHAIPPKNMKFTQFVDIIFGKWKRDVLIDVIGMVREIGYTQLQIGSKKQQINLVLKDLGNNTIHCTLWKVYALHFHDCIQKRKDSSLPTIISLQFAKLKEEGKYHLCVLNTFNVIKLHINDDSPDINDFLNRSSVLAYTIHYLFSNLNMVYISFNDALSILSVINHKIPKMEGKQWSCQNLTTQSHNWSQTSTSSQLTPYDKFMYKVVVLPLAHIIQLKM